MGREEEFLGESRKKGGGRQIWKGIMLPDRLATR